MRDIWPPGTVADGFLVAIGRDDATSVTKNPAARPIPTK